MNYINSAISFFGCSSIEEPSCSGSNRFPNAQKLKLLPSNSGDESLEALQKWKSLYPSNRHEVGSALNIFKFGEKVLKDLGSGQALSHANADQIGCHLWRIAKTSEERTGRNSLYHYFYSHLLDYPEKEKKDVALMAQIAMTGSPARIENKIK